jgi:NDP-sugar pyrophosphorylase family protein
MNGDQITDLDLRSILKVQEDNAETLATIGLMHPKLPFGLVNVDSRDYCTNFVEKPVLKSIYCSTGIYVFRREILNYLPDTGDIEKTTFPLLASQKKLQAYRHVGSFVTVNSLRELEEAEAQLGEKH